MAASVRIEAGAFGDPRFELLGQLCGYNRHEALGRMANLWSLCTDRQEKIVDRVLVAACLGAAGPEAIVQAGLGDAQPDGRIRVRGTEERINWLGKKREAAQRGGQARAAAGRDQTGRYQPPSSHPPAISQPRGFSDEGDEVSQLASKRNEIAEQEKRVRHSKSGASSHSPASVQPTASHEPATDQPSSSSSPGFASPLILVPVLDPPSEDQRGEGSPPATPPLDPPSAPPLLELVNGGVEPAPRPKRTAKPKPKDPPNADHDRFVLRFTELFSAKNLGVPPDTASERARRTVRAILRKPGGADEAMRRAENMFAAPPPWPRPPYDLSTLDQHWDKFAQPYPPNARASPASGGHYRVTGDEEHVDGEVDL